MATLYSLPLPIIGTSGFIPDFRMAAFGDNSQTITNPGYLNNLNLEGCQPLSTNSIIMAFYSYTPQTGGSIDNFNFFGVAIDGNGIITLQPW